MNSSKRISLLLSLLLSSFVQAQHVLDQMVATELLRGSTGGLAVGALQSNEDFLRQYTAGVLEQELAQEAARRGLTERMDVQRALHATRMRVLVQALQADVIRGIPAPTEEEVETVYNQQPERFRVAEALQVDLFVFDLNDNAARDFARQAVRGRKIDAATAAEVGGRQLAGVSEEGEGWVAKDAFPEEVWNALKSARSGTVHQFPLEERILLVKRHGHREERQATMEEARVKLREAMLQQRQQAVWTEFLQQRRRGIGFEN
ncbi:MAG: peptidyl-prolyl cis-trans isomerase [Verrucomicrobia bacterium]|nr:peptidyl-prolyl cis-trans isomerase [Verrucomicrobiota bacterium]MCH8527646.1 peptidyl-prolyl cis-trans isomerase [Kiritimatiellia bacterium]